MPYNKEIDERAKEILSGKEITDSRKMFGGTCYLKNGNMVCGVYKDYLILRLGKDNAPKHFENDSVRPFDITGKPMKGWIMVEQSGFKTKKELETWLNEAIQFVDTLPAK